MLELAGYYELDGDTAEPAFLPTAADRVLVPMMANLAVALSA